MIKISIKKENESIKEIYLKGHALFADYGSDIVCASVSSIVITTINACLLFDKESVSTNDKDGLLIKINKNTDEIDKLICNMLNMLKELEEQYPKNIKFL